MFLKLILTCVWSGQVYYGVRDIRVLGLGMYFLMAIVFVTVPSPIITDFTIQVVDILDANSN